MCPWYDAWHRLTVSNLSNSDAAVTAAPIATAPSGSQGVCWLQLSGVTDRPSLVPCARLLGGLGHHHAARRAAASAQPFLRSTRLRAGGPHERHGKPGALTVTCLAACLVR